MTGLKLENAQGLMRKISNNLLNFGDEKVTAFTLPIEGVALTAEQLDALLGQYTHRSWFDQKGDGSWHPMPWWAGRDDRDFPLALQLDCAAVTIVVSGDRKLEFESEKAANKDEKDRPAARITNIVLVPQAGGMTLLSFHLQVRPGLDQNNLLLQEHQFRHVSISLGDTAPAKARSSAQQTLPLEPAGQQQQPSPSDGEGPRPVSGGFVQTKSAEDIDAEMRARHPDAPLMGEPDAPAARATTTGDSTVAGAGESNGLEAFEEGTRAQLAAFNAKPGEVIDGRSERVKHEDRRRRRAAETH